jgi:hypothetical protein
MLTTYEESCLLVFLENNKTNFGYCKKDQTRNPWSMLCNDFSETDWMFIIFIGCFMNKMNKIALLTGTSEENASKKRLKSLNAKT